MQGVADGHARSVATLGIKNWEVCDNLVKKIHMFKRAMPLIANLKEPAIRQRHWNMLMNELGVTFHPYSDSFTLNTIFEMKFQEYSKVVATMAMIAKKEYEVEQGLEEINARWAWPSKHQLRALEGVGNQNGSVTASGKTLLA